MSSIIKVNTVQDADGNNIINESGDVITVGAAGDTVTVAGNVVKSNALQASDAGNIVSQSGTTITVGASGDTVALASGASQTGFGSNAFRNIIINGDMSIAQRGTSATSLTGSGYNTCDRWRSQISSAGTWSQSQSTDVPTGQGFATSYKWDCTTADASLAAGDSIIFQQRVEAQFLQYLKKGTSYAESLTLSFWVRSNKTGTYIANLYDENNRNISKAYTISAADTWEKKTLTFAGDTSGAFGNDNAIGLYVQFFLAAGSNMSSGTLATSWESYTAANQAVGQVNLADSTSNEWYITGVQLEAGTSASDFEFLPHDVNYNRCARYYYRQNGESGFASGSAYVQDGTVKSYMYHSAPVPMRTQVSMSLSNTTGGVIQLDGGQSDNITNIQESRSGVPYKDYTVLIITNGSSITDKCGVSIRINSSQYIEANAEL